MLMLDVIFCWPGAVARWMVSPAGSAVASWASSFAGIVALVIALRAYLNDKQRAQDDRVREQARLNQVVTDYLDVAISLIDEGIQCLRKLEAGAQARVTTTVFAGSTAISNQLHPIADALERIASGLAPNATITLSVSRSIATFRKAIGINASMQMRPADIASAATLAIEGAESDRATLVRQYPNEVL